MSQSDPDLLTPFLPCFLRVLEVLDNEGASVESAVFLRDELFASLNAASESVSVTATPQTTSLARRMAEAWCDERLATDPWRYREDWLPNPLQSDWGEGRQAGEWVFDAIAALDPVREEHAGIAALALRCLALGFRGRMDKTPADLLALRKSLADKFGFSTIGAPFPPEVKVESRQGGGKKRGLWRPAVCLALGLAVLATGWWLAARRLDALTTTVLTTSSTQ